MSSDFEGAVWRNLDGVYFFSPGACPGCPVCFSNLSKECPQCEGLGDLGDGSVCPRCGGDGEISREPTWQEIDIADEPHFSRCSCDSCGTTLGGDRYPAHGVIADSEDEARESGDIEHFEICRDCVMYHANGELPENWRRSARSNPGTKRPCECGTALGVSCDIRDLDEGDAVYVRWMPPYLRGSHEAAGYGGVSGLGAAAGVERLRVHWECAPYILCGCGDPECGGPPECPSPTPWAEMDWRRSATKP